MKRNCKASLAIAAPCLLALLLAAACSSASPRKAAAPLAIEPSADFVSSCEGISSWVEEQGSLAFEIQSLLAAHPAVPPEGDGDGELERCNALQKRLAEMGFSNFERFDAADSRVSSGTRPNLLVTIPGRKEEALWIITHLDVVPPGELSLWETDPWTAVEKDGKIYTRGAEDNQQSVAAAIIAGLYFIENGVTPERTIKLLFVADEEFTSVYGMRHIIEINSERQLFSKSDIIIVPEGGDPEGKSIEIAEKNLLWLDIFVHGQQTHGSRPDLGVNAHQAGAALLLKLHDLEKTFSAVDPIFEPPYSTFQATRKRDNVPNINTIPGEDFFSMDCRILPSYSLDEVRAAMRKIVSEIEEEYNVSVTITEADAFDSLPTAGDAPAVTALASAVKAVLGVDCKLVGIGGGTVAAYLRNEGFDAVVWGIVDSVSHQANEYSIVDYLLKQATVFAALAIQ